jgi:D-apiose dehydrogenase
MSDDAGSPSFPMKPLRFAIFGTGFWSRFQLAAWRELKGADCVALYNRTRARAEALGREFGIAAVYDDPGELLAREQVDFVDIISDAGSHARLTRLAAEHGRAVICQKPMAATLRDAEAMVRFCGRKQVPFFVHENFRWQAPLRALHAELARGTIGRPFRARIDFISGFPVFKNQPFLAELEQFILTDVGSHTLDVARFLFGEARSIYCRTQRVHPGIKGEDVATIVLELHNGMHVTVNMAYAGNALEREAFPETLVFVEAENGSAELAPGCELRITTRRGTLIRKTPPPFHAWADPRYAVVHASIMPCNANLLAALQGRASAETTGEDNLKTVRLVFGAYASAARNKPVLLA